MKNSRDQGFTIIEMVIVMVLISILAVMAVARWPTGIKERAAVLEFKRALRYAQHKAITRQFTTAASAWGLTVSANKYSVQRKDDPGSAESGYRDRALPDNAPIAPDGVSVWFNGLGEPIDDAGDPLATLVTFNIGTTGQVSVCPESGYVKEGGTCP